MKIEFENVETDRHQLKELHDGGIAVLLEQLVTGSGTLPLGTVVQRCDTNLVLLGVRGGLGYPNWFRSGNATTVRIQLLSLKVIKVRRPFNLEEAKAGKRVVTREGTEVRFVDYDSRHKDASPIVVSDGTGFRTHYIDGQYYLQIQSSWDLFMED